jgi:thioredoxin 1
MSQGIFMSEAEKGTGNRAVIIVVLIILIAGVVYLKNNKKKNESDSKAKIENLETDDKPMPKTVENNTEKTATEEADTSNSAEAEREIKLPRLLDLGAGKCIPCKMMEPILEDLKLSHAKEFKVDFIDVWKDQEAGKKHNIRMIPTQIFFDGNGKELYRHEGFFSKEEILNKWKELGISVSEK